MVSVIEMASVIEKASVIEWIIKPGLQSMIQFQSLRGFQSLRQFQSLNSVHLDVPVASACCGHYSWFCYAWGGLLYPQMGQSGRNPLSSGSEDPVSQNLLIWVGNDIQIKFIYHSQHQFFRAIFHSQPRKPQISPRRSSCACVDALSYIIHSTP